MAALDRGERAEEVAARLEVHATTVRAWRRARAGGRLEPQKVGAKSIPTKLTPGDVEAMRGWVAERPGITLREMVERLEARGTRVVESTVHRALKKLGLTFKKSRWSPASRSDRQRPSTAATSASL